MSESEVKQVVTERNAAALDANGAAVRQTTRDVRTERPANKKLVAANLVWYLFGLIAILLAARFVLKLAGANADNGFVSFVYAVSHVFSAPFDTIFGTTNVGHTQSVFQPSILVAIAVYALVAWGIVKLINIASREN